MTVGGLPGEVAIPARRIASRALVVACASLAGRFNEAADFIYALAFPRNVRGLATVRLGKCLLKRQHGRFPRRRTFPPHGKKAVKNRDKSWRRTYVTVVRPASGGQLRRWLAGAGEWFTAMNLKRHQRRRSKRQFQRLCSKSISINT
jgi:hypothetical protein